MSLIPTLIALAATAGFYCLVKILNRAGRLEIGLPVGFVLLVIGKYVLPPLADEPEYFFWVACFSIPLGVFGALFGTLGLGALVVKFLQNWSAKLNKKRSLP